MVSSRTNLKTFHPYLFRWLDFRLVSTIATMQAATATRQPNTVIVAAAAGLKASAVVELNLEGVVELTVRDEEKLWDKLWTLVMGAVEIKVVSELFVVQTVLQLYSYVKLICC